MVKITNRTFYDSVYQCLVWCRDYENSSTLPTTKSRFLNIIGGNYGYYKKFMDVSLLGQKLIEVNPDIKYHTTIYRITDKGRLYIKTYEKLQELLGRKWK